MRYQAALRPDWLAHLGRATNEGKAWGGDVARRGRKARRGKWLGRLLSVILAIPALYLAAALAGSLIPVNRDWREPAEGTTVYLADNGVHVDVILPIDAHGLDWRPLIPPHDFAKADPNASFIAFGSGERRVYLDTPTWWDLTPRTLSSALFGGDRVMHAEYVPSPAYAVRQIRLRPDEYRRLWAAIRSDFALDKRGRPRRIDHPGYGPSDAFYRASGKASAITTCNSWAASRLRLAGVKTSLWPPFAQGLVWRYRQYNGLALFRRS
ncbi:MAG TPA: TIGR02117 family protein [Sphingomicrobium sp.]|nr:TIGR02117 family protein [Sphingomicrobium sp.]